MKLKFQKEVEIFSIKEIRGPNNLSQDIESIIKQMINSLSPENLKKFRAPRNT